MRKLFNALTQAFERSGGTIDQQCFTRIVEENAELYEDAQTIFHIAQASGYPITYDQPSQLYRLESFFTPYKQQRYCIVDIETNGGNPARSQVIEIGAVMVQEGRIIDRFETFVACAYLPDAITQVTGITPQDLANAPSHSEALQALRVFMQDAVFVAHNVRFDYEFLNASFERFGLGTIGNLRLCTIDLARRTFFSEKYGLAYLRETLEIDVALHHRAYADALSAYHVMQKACSLLPKHIQTTHDLIRFSLSKQSAGSTLNRTRSHTP